jgi:hypothetical protein
MAMMDSPGLISMRFAVTGGRCLEASMPGVQERYAHSN